MRLRNALALAAALAICLPANAGAKSKLDDKIHAEQRKIHDLHLRRNAKRAQLDSARARVSTIAAQLDQANRNIASVSARLDALQAQIRSTQRKLAWNQVQLGAAKATLTRHQHALDRRLVDAYEHGDLGYVDVLLHARSFSDFIERWNDVRYLVRATQTTIRQRQADEKRVLAIETGLLGTQSQLQDQQAQVSQQKLALDGLAAQRRQLLDAADAERAQVQTEVTQLEEESAAYEAYLENLIRQKQEEEEQRRLADRRARQLAGEDVGPEPTAPGHLIWPLSGPITSPFGMRTNPVTHAFILHSGIDIGVPVGTTVAAAAAGKVIVAGWDDGGCGNFIVIDHGGRLSTQYCHLSQMFVGVGQEVQQGQAIAASGNTGNTTGPHLHFGVRVNGKPVDPMTYLR